MKVIIIACIWISYGLYSCNKTITTIKSKDSNSLLITAFIIFAPLVACYRAIFGMFGKTFKIYENVFNSEK